MNVGFAVASVGGAAIGGLLVSEVGVGTALLADAASFLAIAAVIGSTRGLPPAEVEPEHWLARLRDGMRFVRAERLVRILLVGQAVALILFTLIIPIEVVYAKASLETTSTGYGILLAAWGAGIVIGSAIYVLVKSRSAFSLIIVSSTAIALSSLGRAGAQSLLMACLLSVLGGMGNGIQWIAVMTALQEATPLNLQAGSPAPWSRSGPSRRASATSLGP
jgi:hypothetical protein